jgi:Cys-tRNA synthase (O-phospho-L-seryl-tRNA:Cys-tRNA synthase)
MQKYCQDKQFEALANLRARNMAGGAYATIRKKCTDEWGADYKMRDYCEENQVEAYRELNR